MNKYNMILQIRYVVVVVVVGVGVVVVQNISIRVRFVFFYSVTFACMDISYKAPKNTSITSTL